MHWLCRVFNFRRGVGFGAEALDERAPPPHQRVQNHCGV
eukprot:SAG11_NODE_18935_length_478_cov_0.620053_1_plen_38_part_10